MLAVHRPSVGDSKHKRMMLAGSTSNNIRKISAKHSATISPVSCQDRAKSVSAMTLPTRQRVTPFATHCGDNDGLENRRNIERDVPDNMHGRDTE